MNKASFLFLGAVLSIAGTSMMLAGCSGDTGTGTGGSTGTGSDTTSTTGAGGAGTTASASASGSTGTGATATLDCTSYCAEVMTNCTAANTQYASMDSCMNVCAAFTPGMLGATEGGTLGCHLYHGGAPAVATPDTHCAHAGPTGGDKIVTDALPGTCGEGCDSFCTIAGAVCKDANKQYADKETCLTACKSFKPDAANYSTANTDKDNFGCRMYHLTVAATDAASAKTHCSHIIAASTQCTK